MKRNFILILILILIFSCSIKNNSPVQIITCKPQKNNEASLRGLHVINENIIWASGSNGIVLKSVDGGKNWNTLQIEGEEKNDFRSIYAWDENKAIVFGVSGPNFGYKTINGGENWQVVYSDTLPGLFFNSLTFADKNNGLAVSDPVDGKFFVIRTENAGEKWENVTNIPDAIDGEANFAASNTCIEFLPSGKAWIASGGKAARVFYSENFGKSWQVSNTPIIRGTAAAGIFSVSFKNDLEGIIVGGIYNEPHINQNIAAYTLDGGKSWIQAQTMPNEYRSCVQHVTFENKTFSFAIGKTGSDISPDGGMNWQFADTTGFYTFRQVPGKNTGFAAGSNGKISKLSFNF